MSKKHFIALAAMIAANREHFSDAALGKLAEFCHEQNHNFDQHRWIGFINGECGPHGGEIKRPFNKVLAQTVRATRDCFTDEALQVLGAFCDEDFTN